MEFCGKTFAHLTNAIFLHSINLNMLIAFILKIIPPIVIPNKLIEFWLSYRIKRIKDEFERIVWRLSYYATHHGAKSTCMAFFISPMVFMLNSKRREVFIKKCHEGFDITQNEIVKLLPEIEARLPVLRVAYRKEVKRFRKDRKPPIPRYSKAGIEYSKQLFYSAVLREIANAIAWQILGNDGTKVRALIQGILPGPIQRSNLENTLETANKLNLQEKTGFALVTDITSCIQVGDLLLRLPTGQFGLCELKDGVVNKNIEDLLAISPVGQAAFDRFNQLAGEFGESFVKQFRRVLRQNERMIQALEYINTSVGVDIQCKKSKLTDVEPRITVAYYKEINRLLQKARKKGEEYLVVDECLVLGAFNTVKLNRSSDVCKKDFQHQVWHIFFEDWSECPYGKKVDEQKIKKHFEYMLLPVWEMRNKIHIPTHRPLFITGIVEDFVIDILFERMTLFSYFSPQGFVELCKKKGIAAAWITGGEYRRIKDEALKNKIVLLDIHDGIIRIKDSVQDFTQEIGLGILYKIIYEFERPSSVVEAIKEDLLTLPERLKKLEKRPDNS
jgi:hypothetical protein